MNLIVVRGRQQEYEDPADGTRYWSTSELLRVLDPSIFEGVHHQTLELARQRGVDLHKYFFYALAVHGRFAKQVPKDLALGWEGYQAAIWKWIADYQPKPLLLEERSVNRKWKVAGTADAKCLIQGKITLLDLKTGGKERIHEAQLNCYVTMEDFADAQRMATLYIRSEGTYAFERVYKNPLHLAALQNSLQVLQWRKQT